MAAPTSVAQQADPGSGSDCDRRSPHTEKTKLSKVYGSTAMICEKVRQLCKAFPETQESQAKEYTNEKDK